MNRTRRLWLPTLVLAVAPAVPLVAGEDPEEPGGRPLSTLLTGEQEVPGPGDTDGSGTVDLTLNPGQGQVCWNLSVAGIDTATAAHIHRGASGVAGPVVVPLTPPADGTSDGCADADRDLIREILQTPEQFYVNVHNAEFPEGAIRGQLGK
jgi:hypothetical protein